MMPEVRKNVADRNRGIHRNATKRYITKMFLHGLYANMFQVIGNLWSK